LDRSPESRQFAYRELLKHQIPEVEIHQIREYLAYNYLLGNARFRDQIETALGRMVGEKKRGRPIRQANIDQT
jgi:putative transposase